jgi:16S rRNA processing protein RimM
MAAPEASSRLEVGRIHKAHGLAGDVVVSLSTNRHERVDSGAVLYAGERCLTVGSSKPHGHRFIVRFAGVNGREGADELRGAVLTADPIADPDELWVHELLGVEVIDVDGVGLGAVTTVLDNPASDILVLESGALVPANFIVEFDGARVVVDPPEGLFDI